MDAESIPASSTITLGDFVKDISELRKMMTEEQVSESEKNFRRFYPEGTPIVGCTSYEDEETYLRKVDLKDFD